MTTPNTSQSSPAPLKVFSVDCLQVRIYPRQADLASDAAQLAQKYLSEILGRQDTATAIMASANSQIQFLGALVELGGVDWSRVTLFHMDEYLGLDENHPASFRRFMRERVERLVKPRQFHYLQGDALEPLAECDRYARLLAAQPIDLCCLGIGENGHIAFNDPAVADFNDPHKVKLVKLDPECRQQQVGEGHFARLEAVPQYAITLTIPMLCAAKRMFCIVPEKRKANAVKAALQGRICSACPASFLRRQPQCILFLDAESASLL